ncbi:efflux RND transporter permease subunit [Ktedonobacter robiniae]|uniref:Hydrogenase expression protein n=1 Tax=Ktedonobacter robiniae TaxID=2778365 RepID=A0ABQ3URT4_9CHLR|nr:efflux RND transporter permease subunit [Ktedonobacter robiniae]GHO55410.1 hydrogenase expression protein [Ktedonobacter robiniae]
MSYLSRLSLANRSVVALATIAILLLGGFIIPSLKQELFPSITFPTLSVVAVYPGASPSVVERDVTNPLEQNIQGIKGVQKVTSYSNQGTAVLVVSFDYGTDIDSATQTVTQRINKAQTSLPSNVTPQVQSFSFTDFPIIQLAVSADEDQQVLADALKHDVVPDLQRIDGVGTVNVTGVRTQIVTITVDLQKLKEHGVSFSQLQGALQANNVTLPAGSTTSDGKTIPITAGNTLNSLDDLKNLVVGSQSASTGSGFPGTVTIPGTNTGAGFTISGANTTQTFAPAKPVKLQDVATVKEDLSPSTSLTRTNGQPSLGISLVKTTSGNTVSISQAVNQDITALQNKVGHGAKISVISDQAPSITQSVNDLTREGLIGAFFAIVVILLFLFSLRSTLVTAVSIPLSIVIALIGLYVGNYTLNILTLGGLTIAVGRVVDDSIVVLENIYRHLQEGEEKKSAVLNGVREVSSAVTASTLTTVAVFLPIAFTGGLVGELFRSFSVAVTVALLASLFVALTIIPVLAYWFLKGPKAEVLAKRQATKKHSGSWLERGYVAIVRWVTGAWWQRTVLVVAAIALLVVSFAFAGGLQTNLFGSSNQGAYSVSLTLPPAASLDKSDEIAKQIEQSISDLSDIKTYQVTVGSAGSFSSLSGGSGSNAISFTIVTKDGIDQTAFEKNLRDRLETDKSLGTLTVSAGNSGPTNSSIAINIQANDDQTLNEATKQVQDSISNISGLADITSSLTSASPQYNIVVDSTKAGKIGMTPIQVAQNIRQVYSGSTVTHITVNGSQQDVDLFVGNPASNIDAIKALSIPTTTGSVKIGDIATVTQVNGPTQITHIDGNRTATVNATVTDSNVGAVSANVQQALDKLSVPSGAKVSLGGISADQSDTFSQLGLAVLIAIILVYCIMVATFRSLLQPVILLISIPFAATGSLILLLATNTPLGAAALIGFLMLVGIVVTNAIVLLDLVRQYREQGMTAREAIVEGGRHRLRPILMTAIATILALMPMVLGIGGAGSGGFISRPLAIVVIGGLTTSTILTLIVVPTLYVIAESARGRSGSPTPPPAPIIDETPTSPEVAAVR